MNGPSFNATLSEDSENGINRIVLVLMVATLGMEALETGLRLRGEASSGVSVEQCTEICKPGRIQSWAPQACVCARRP